jgi:hypothetical protein
LWRDNVIAFDYWKRCVNGIDWPAYLFITTRQTSFCGDISEDMSLSEQPNNFGGAEILDLTSDFRHSDSSLQRGIKFRDQFAKNRRN